MSDRTRTILGTVLTRTLQESRTRRRRYPGTGIHDTPLATWTAMRAEYIRGSETLKDIAQRHGVLYSAAHRVCHHDRWYELPTPRPQHPLKATPSRPACPSCGAGSRCRAIGEMTRTFQCSGCGRTWDLRSGGPRLTVINGGLR